MPLKLTLTKKDLLSKQFTVGANHYYDALEVDMFIDSIIADYATIEKGVLLSKDELKEMNNKISTLEDKVRTLELQNASLNNKYGKLKVKGVTQDNLELLKRISALEKFLWEHGYYPDQIKN